LCCKSYSKTYFDKHKCNSKLVVEP
jgi:hypothetical protein